MSIMIHHHILEQNTFTARTNAFNEGKRDEFHTLNICPDSDAEFVLFFRNTQEMITALNELRMVCEAKIWELQGIPEAYDLDSEPF